MSSCSIEPDLDKLPIIQPSLGFSVYQESITLNDVDILTGDSSITKESYGASDSIFVFNKTVNIDKQEVGDKLSIDDINNDINTTFLINNVVTKFNFIEENGERGNSNILASSISYELDDNNFLSFETRRNRKLNLTEFYDLVYEYKNDCLIAGIKYKKTYYSDGDLKPTENLLFTVTLFPLTTYEHDAQDFLND